jgi:UDP-N-acetylmuramate-alanine ligase
LCEAIGRKFNIPSQNVETVERLATYCRENLKPGDVFLTIGAGNIYEVHELLS